MKELTIEGLFDQVQIGLPDGGTHGGSVHRVSSAGAWIDIASKSFTSVECGDKVRLGFLFEGELLGDCEAVVTQVKNKEGVRVCVRFLSSLGRSKVPIGLRMAIEHRNDPRITLESENPVEVDCSLGSERSPLLGRLLNVSAGGAGLAIAEETADLVAGTQMFLRFLLPGQTKICAIRAEVCHVRGDSEQTVCGMKFAEPSCALTERSRVAIRDFVAEQAIGRMRSLVSSAYQRDPFADPRK